LIEDNWFLGRIGDQSFDSKAGSLGGNGGYPYYGGNGDPPFDYGSSPYDFCSYADYKSNVYCDYPFGY
jgi:hypothetical protein